MSELWGTIWFTLLCAGGLWLGVWLLEGGSPPPESAPAVVAPGEAPVNVLHWFSRP